MVRTAVGFTTGSTSTAVRYRSHAAAFAVWAHREGVIGHPGEYFCLELIER
ncbi:MAG: hypothetical protein WKF82_06035 [Nocardioidaceae bacterium]